MTHTHTHTLVKKIAADTRLTAQNIILEGIWLNFCKVGQIISCVESQFLNYKSENRYSDFQPIHSSTIHPRKLRYKIAKYLTLFTPQLVAIYKLFLFLSRIMHMNIRYAITPKHKGKGQRQTQMWHKLHMDNFHSKTANAYYFWEQCNFTLKKCPPTSL